MTGFGLIVRFTLKSGQGDAFDALASRTIEQIRAREAGTLAYLSHRVVDEPDQRIFYELYRDREAFGAHEDQPHVQTFLSERQAFVDSFVVDFIDPVDGKLPQGTSEVV